MRDEKHFVLQAGFPTSLAPTLFSADPLGGGSAAPLEKRCWLAGQLKRSPGGNIVHQLAGTSPPVGLGPGFNKGKWGVGRTPQVQEGGGAPST